MSWMQLKRRGWKWQKKYSIVEKADLILKKDIEHREITRKKKTWQLVVHSMKERSEKAMEIKIELRVIVAEQQDDKTFKVESDIYD